MWFEKLKVYINIRIARHFIACSLPEHIVLCMFEYFFELEYNLGLHLQQFGHNFTTNFKTNLLPATKDIYIDTFSICL